MITPRFHLTQNSETVSFIIRAPYCNLKELDVSVEDNVFIFLCKPYYLRLNLPGNLNDDEHSKSKFDADFGEFTFTYEKQNSGEVFKDLDFITTLMCPKIEVEEGGRTIELFATGNNESIIETKNETNEEYGFAMRGGYQFQNLSIEFSEVFKVDPVNVKLNERRLLRLKKEKDNFNCSHYLADLLDNGEILEICAFKSPWESLRVNEIEFTEKELDFLKDLPNIQYGLNSQQLKYCHNCLVEIMYAYCYDKRTTLFDSTCESPWTIANISASLCWFDGFMDAKEALICAYRRSLIYPLHRSFSLCERVFEDLKTVLKLGEKFIIKCLIEVYYLFVHGDAERYVLNNLFIKDYITYIMKWDKESWKSVVEEVGAVHIEKTELGLNILEIEKSIPKECDLNEMIANLRLEAETDSDDSKSITESSSSSYQSCDNNEAENCLI